MAILCCGCKWSCKCVKVPLTEDQLKGLIKRYDTNRDGKLSLSELRLAFRNLGLRHSGGRAWLALQYADANGDRFISEEELNQLVKFAFKWGFTIN